MHWGFPYQITSLPGCYNIFKTKVCGPSKNEIKATPFGTKHFQFTQKDCSKSRSVYTITNLVTKKLTACPPEDWNSVCKHSLVSVDISVFQLFWNLFMTTYNLPKITNYTLTFLLASQVLRFALLIATSYPICSYLPAFQLRLKS